MPDQRTVCISDTHNLHSEVALPIGDILIHAGDATLSGSLEEVSAFNEFLAGLPHEHKIVIAGNHDFAFERQPEQARALMTACTYLQDEEIEINGLRIYGSPWQPWFFDWAFNLQRGEDIRAKWDLIPDGIDILVTHGPPAGYGDRTRTGEHVGCADLLEAVQRIRPRFHIFGHIHEGAGIEPEDTTVFINASVCDEDYAPAHAPVVIDA